MIYFCRRIKELPNYNFVSVAQVEEEENYPVVNSRHPKSVVPDQVRLKLALTFHTSNQPAVLRPSFLSWYLHCKKPQQEIFQAFFPVMRHIFQRFMHW